MVGGQQAGVGKDGGKQPLDDFGSIRVFLLHAGRFVQVGVEKLFGGMASGFHLRAQSHEALGRAANLI